MIGVIGRYITGLFMARFWGLLFGLTILVIILDLLSHGDEILAISDSLFSDSFRYIGLRTPETASQLFPFAVLLTTLTTLIGLVRTSEMAALLAAGVSQIRLMSAFVPSALLIALLQLCVEDQLLPLTSGELRAWGVGDYGLGTDQDEQGQTWLREGRDVVRIGLRDDSGRYEGITIFRRDDKGNLIERIDARSAVLLGNNWHLEGIKWWQFETRELTTVERMEWQTELGLQTLALLSTHPRELSFRSLRRMVDTSGFGSRPRYMYDVWLQKRISRPAATVLMILMAIPLVQFFQNRMSGGWLLASGVVLGFFYWIFDGLLLTIGEAGLMPPPLAAWTPILVFTALALYLSIRWDASRATQKK